MNKKTRGFTLMEVIIVVAIIAILASAVLIALNPAKNLRDARNATRWSQMNSITNGIYSYVIENKGLYPDCLSTTTGRIIYDEDASSTAWNLVDIETCDELTPIFLPSFPKEPQDKEYVVGYMDATSSDRIIIRCTADEAIDDNILIVN
ncbi:MAG TPA: prepilin-type N-terminal cleavage/methylation domain-containing protein [Candidatus Paceibacterota bacterium]|nr:prepilin-type N-terminal cleavage/methylation domain-containing protein [Candidatus Paceibacterota bacterium]